MTEPKLWTAAEMLPLAAEWLLVRYPGAKLVEEFVCGRAFMPRIDLAAITDDEIVGVEIKACSDDGRSLGKQGYAFSAVCRHTFLFTGPGAYSRTLQHRPEFWGDLRIGETAKGALAYPNIEAPVSPVESAHALLGLLWREELLRMASALGFQPLSKSKAHARIADDLANAFPLALIRAGVVDALRRRRWRTAFKRIGAQVMPPEEAA